METISSTANKKIKNLGLLIHKSSERKAQGLTVAEGEKEIQLAIASGVQIDSLFLCEEIISNHELASLCRTHCADDQTYLITPEIFKKVAYRDDSGGILITVKTKLHTFDTIVLPENPLIVILEKVEKPGNLGAVLRTCDAAAIDLLIICDPNTDIYNPNVIRSGIGCVFSQQMMVCHSTEAIAWLKKNKIQLLSAALQNSSAYVKADYTKPTAIVFGTEATGLTRLWIQEADRVIKIPMLGKIDSLNVSNSVAIIVYEALRQRQI